MIQLTANQIFLNEKQPFGCLRFVDHSITRSLHTIYNRLPKQVDIIVNNINDLFTSHNTLSSVVSRQIEIKCKVFVDKLEYKMI